MHYYLSVLCQQISSLFARILLRRLAGSTAYSLESVFKCDQRSEKCLFILSLRVPLYLVFNPTSPPPLPTPSLAIL